MTEYWRNITNNNSVQITQIYSHTSDENFVKVMCFTKGGVTNEKTDFTEKEICVFPQCDVHKVKIMPQSILLQKFRQSNFFTKEFTLL